jgi:hypothetical protein
MKRFWVFLIFAVFVISLWAQNAPKGDTRAASPNTVIKADGGTNTWVKSENETSTTTLQNSGTDNVNFTSTASGINITITGGTNKIKLFALTGQLIFNGDLTQGRFFIPTPEGIFFLRINNKRYKVVCK